MKATTECTHSSQWRNSLTRFRTPDCSLRRQSTFPRCVIALKLQPRFEYHEAMGYAVAATTARSIVNRPPYLTLRRLTRRAFHAWTSRAKSFLEPRLEDHGRVIRDEYSVIRDNYGPYPDPNHLSLASRIDLGL